jgi:hypothetical protein
MSYTLRWKNPSLNANKAAEIIVPVASIISDKSSLRFTGKGAPGYGTIQQENQMRLLENFADTIEPSYPTVGQEWFDTGNGVLKICTSTSPTVWKALGGIQVSDTAPSPAAIGDLWFQRTGARSGIMYVYTSLGRFPQGTTTIGGWNQIFPTVETIAGREEYDNLLSLVNSLVGPTAGGGNGALGRSLPSFTDLTVYDADLVKKFQASTDANVVTPVQDTLSELRVDTISADWDMLLAAAKYAVDRLDLPASMVDDISPVPFVSDGRQAPSALTSLSTSNVRYPTLERRSNRRFGMVTLIRAFTETVNVLNAAVANRYALKGINGSSGTNATFAPTTEVIDHVTFSGTPGGATSEQLSLRFNFATAAELQSFLNSGGAIQLTMSHALGSSPTAQDTNLKNLLDSKGILRFTADKTRVFANVYPLALAAAPTTPGVKDAPAGGVQLTTQILSGAQYGISVGIQTPTQFGFAISITGGGALNGTTTIGWQVIRDNTTYAATNATVKVFGAPIAYVNGDKTGSTFLV